MKATDDGMLHHLWMSEALMPVKIKSVCRKMRTE